MVANDNSWSEWKLQSSLAVSPDLYVHNPDYFSSFKPRISRHAQLSDDATIQFQIDLLGRENIGKVMANLDTDYGNWIVLSAPFCFRDRLAIISYANEAAFIHDDIEFKETLETKKIGADPMVPSNAPDEEDKYPEYAKEKRNEQVVRKIIAKLIETDFTRGRKVIEKWETWRRGEKTIGPKAGSYTSLQEYLVDRKADVGYEWAMSLIYFGCEISLTDDEEAVIAPMALFLWHVMALTNDYFSYEKEYIAYVSSDGKRPLVNAVALYVKWYSMSVEEAKASLKQKMIELEAEYHQAKQAYLASPCVSFEVLRWLEIVEHCVAGNLLWSMTCPRYNQKPNNQYIDYYQMRCSQGFCFHDDCTQSDSILSNQSKL